MVAHTSARARSACVRGLSRGRGASAKPHAHLEHGGNRARAQRVRARARACERARVHARAGMYLFVFVSAIGRAHACKRCMNLNELVQCIRVHTFDRTCANATLARPHANEL
eukprot:3928736-Pleurochrysis_carterae.AAC.1